MQNVGASVYRYIHRSIYDAPAVGVIFVLDLDLRKDSRYGGRSENGFGAQLVGQVVISKDPQLTRTPISGGDPQHLVRLPDVLEIDRLFDQSALRFIRNDRAGVDHFQQTCFDIIAGQKEGEASSVKISGKKRYVL